MDSINIQDQLMHGAILGYPTDTCLGIGHLLISQTGYKNLYTTKQMPTTKPFSILVTNIKMAENYGQFSPLAKHVWAEIFPGPFTIIVPQKVNTQLNQTNKLVGIRLNTDPWLQEILKQTNSPISTTSANIHGQPTCQTLSNLKEQFGNKIIYAPTIKPNHHYYQPPSTIVKCANNKLEIVRQGSPESLNLLQQKFAEFF